MYHKLSIEETLKALDVSPENGLSYEEAAFRLDGASESKKGDSIFKYLAPALARPGVWLLLVAAALALLLDGFVSALLIVAVIIINTILSAIRKKRGLSLINHSVRPTVTHATVLRSGAKMRVPSDELVVGDIVYLKPGRVVPADLRLIISDGLLIDESALTGKNEVLKDASGIIHGDVPPEMRKNCAFEGTVILRGKGVGIVISTGMSTELFRLSKANDTPESEAAPILSRTKKISSKLTLATSLICLFIFVAGLLFGHSLLESAAACIALAVAAIPESLYTAALTALSKGAGRLTEKGFAIKDIKSVEVLGAVGAYITDIPKLGVAATFTNGRRKAPHEEDSSPFIDGLLLCELGNSVLSAYASHRCDAAEIRAAFPKIAERGGEVSTTLHKAGKTTVSFSGGDALEILDRSDKLWEFGKIRSLTESDRGELRSVILSFRSEGLIPTAIGMRSGDSSPVDTGLVFLGIVATTEEADFSAVPDTEALRALNIPIYVLTSEDSNRARMGAEALSVPYEKILTGREVELMSSTALSKALSDTFVFAGLTPKDKTRISLALRHMGYTVCATGTTLSDIALLESADVGISESRSEDAVKSAADIIRNGDSTAETAVLLGSVIRENLSRAITYLISANLAELVCVGLCVVGGFGYPMSPAQILLVNILTDIFPVMFFAISRSRRARCNSRILYLLGGLSGVLGAASFVIFSLIPSLRDFAGLTCAVVLAVLELLLVIPTHLLGGFKNAE